MIREVAIVERFLPKHVELPPVHPGEVLMKGFLKEISITRHKLAVYIGVPRQ